MEKGNLPSERNKLAPKNETRTVILRFQVNREKRSHGKAGEEEVEVCYLMRALTSRLVWGSKPFYVRLASVSYLREAEAISLADRLCLVIKCWGKPLR
jgi:hypothetical protein